MITDDDLARLAKVLRVLNDGLPQAPGLNVRNVKAYALVLQGLSLRAISAGVLRILRTWDMATLLPPPAVVRRAALEEIAEQMGLPSAEQAWAEVRHKINEYGVRGVPLPGGGYGPIEWSHPVVADAVDAMGGVTYISGSDNVSTDRAHWLKQIYPVMVEVWNRQFAGQLATGAQPAALINEGGTDDGETG